MKVEGNYMSCVRIVANSPGLLGGEEKTQTNQKVFPMALEDNGLFPPRK